MLPSTTKILSVALPLQSEPSHNNFDRVVGAGCCTPKNEHQHTPLRRALQTQKHKYLVQHVKIVTTLVSAPDNKCLQIPLCPLFHCGLMDRGYLKISLFVLQPAATAWLPESGCFLALVPSVSALESEWMMPLASLSLEVLLWAVFEKCLRSEEDHLGFCFSTVDYDVIFLVMLFLLFEVLRWYHVDLTSRFSSAASWFSIVTFSFLTVTMSPLISSHCLKLLRERAFSSSCCLKWRRLVKVSRLSCTSFRSRALSSP